MMAEQVWTETSSERAWAVTEGRRDHLLGALHEARWSGDGACWAALLEQLVTLEGEALGAAPALPARRRAADAMARELLDRWFTDAQHHRAAAAPTPEAPEQAADRELILAQIVALALAPTPSGAPSPLGLLAARFELSAVDVWMVLVLHLAMTDPFFHAACAEAAARPGVAPDLGLLCGMLLGRPGPLWALGRQRLHPCSPLRRYALLERADLRDDLLTAPLRLASSVVGALDAWPALSAEVAGLGRWQAHRALPAEATAGLDPDALDALAASLADGAPLVVLSGAAEHGRAAFMEAAAAEAGLGLLTLDPARVVAAGPEESLTRALRDARLLGALVVLPLDGLDAEAAPSVVAAAARLALTLGGPLTLAVEVLHGDVARAVGPAPRFELPPLPEPARAARWRGALQGRGLHLPAAALALLARHPLTFEAIGRAAGQLKAGPELAASAEGAAQRQLADHRGGLTELVQVKLGWNDLVLSPEILDQLMEIISFSRYQEEVLEGWGFGSKLPYGRGLTALFYGAPGTGKTMVAGLIARELGKPLLRVNIAEVTSKWIGETEKNLALVFDEARRRDAVLLFDEADALFGKRTEVKSSNDRYANMNVNFLLQTLESWDGVVLLTTNLEASIDEAFKRRLRFKVEFDAPGADLRARLWASVIPARAQTTPDLRFEALGSTFELSGGYIKEAALRAAFTAAERGEPLSHDLLWAAAERIYRELGRVVLSAKRA